jgi:2-iminobutanoate/2-iminopropanoate deaminase
MNKIYNPAEVPPPIGAYSHAIEVAAGVRTLHISGQVGTLPGGKVAQGIEAQCDAVWNNIKGILRGAGMDVGDLVKVTAFLVNKADIPASRAVRLKHLGDHKPASTLLVIDALASPEFLVEIEAIAAKG